MACGQSDLLYTCARGTENACGKPCWIWLGGIPGITSGRLSSNGQEWRLGLLREGDGWERRLNPRITLSATVGAECLTR
jgi:hypothetical protein